MKIQFSIRDLLWLIALAALAAEWWFDRSKLTQQWEADHVSAIEERTKLQGEIANMISELTAYR
jgi:ferric-dicitrate binding protein FerR (iron transport regulator)